VLYLYQDMIQVYPEHKMMIWSLHE
jgi:hypothetical protein